MTSELRPALAVWADALVAQHNALQEPNGRPNQAAAAAIKAALEAVRAPLLAENERLREALRELVEEYVRNVDCTRLGGFYLDPETEDCIIHARATLAGENND